MVMFHRDFRDLSSFSPFYAIEEGGSFLICYAVMFGGLVGLLGRILIGNFFVVKGR
jgi:hypothetical protein